MGIDGILGILGMFGMLGILGIFILGVSNPLTHYLKSVEPNCGIFGILGILIGLLIFGIVNVGAEIFGIDGILIGELGSLIFFLCSFGQKMTTIM